jgi:23S rRNA pseudouridine2605 synthase
MTERLQKVLARAGLGSRRKCEEWISAGRVSVNGQTVSALGTKVDPGQDDIRFDGQPIASPRKAYYLLHKPKGYIVTQSDEFGRKRAIDLLLGVREHVVAVGRLDQDSTGLLLFTNDGDLANRLTHPRYGVPKTYQVMVKGLLDPSVPDRLLHGLHLAEGKVKAAAVSVRYTSYEVSALEVTLREGRNREIRRMLERLGCKVKSLKRVRFGPLTDVGLPVGRFRRLTEAEVESLQAGGSASPSPAGKRQRPGTKKRKPPAQ